VYCRNGDGTQQESDQLLCIDAEVGGVRDASGDRRSLESFFIGRVVGSFTSIRPAAEITRQIVADCEQRIADLGRLLTTGTTITGALS
jgi:hypothetical protein